MHSVARLIVGSRTTALIFFGGVGAYDCVLETEEKERMEYVEWKKKGKEREK